MTVNTQSALLSTEALATLFEGVKVCVVGDVMLDRYSYGTVERISPEAPVPVMQIVRREEVPGAAANVFANLLALGVASRLIGITGTDSDSVCLRDLCDNIAPTLGKATLLPVANRVTTVKHRMVAITGQQMLRVDQEDVSPIRAEDVAHAWVLIADAVHDADVIVVADYAKGFMVPALAERLVAHAHMLGKPIIVDTKPSHFTNYRGATLFTPNEKETMQLFPDKDFKEAGRALTELCGGNILATRGSSGIHFFPYTANDGAECVFPAFPTDVRDVSGAGDTVTAVAALMIAACATPHQMADVSNRAASVVVGKPRTAVLTREELFEVMER